jgi:hypothetical protein
VPCSLTGRGKVHRGFWWGSVCERDRLELRHRWGMLLKWIFKKLVVVVGWIDLPHDRKRWQAFVNPAMNLCRS